MKTIIKKINEHDIDAEVIKQAGEILKNGGLVVFPTETVYGLGADALNSEAAKRTYDAKGRPSDNPLIVHIADLQALNEIIVNPPKELAELNYHFWPGPLTIIFNKAEQVPVETTGNLETVAVRMPENLIAREIILAGGGYISAPSANLSGRPSPTTAEHVREDLNGRVDMIIDGGSVNIGVESTILDMTVSPPVILRPGAITLEMLQEVIPDVTMGSNLFTASEEGPKAPGMKYRHYAPKAPLVVVEGEPKEAVKAIKQLAFEYMKKDRKIGIICTNETADDYTIGEIKSIGSRENEKTIARNLYGILREFDQADVDCILSESFYEAGIGTAVMNRLLKAAGHRTISAEEVTKLQRIRRILLVGNGDNCRGPMTARLLKERQLIQEYEIGSRGLVVLFPEPVNSKAQAIMEQKGKDLSHYEATLLIPEDLDEETLVLTMEEGQKQKILSEFAPRGPVFTICEYIGEESEVKSIHGQPLEEYETLYYYLEDITKKIAKRLNQEVQEEWNKYM